MCGIYKLKKHTSATASQKKARFIVSCFARLNEEQRAAVYKISYPIVMCKVIKDKLLAYFPWELHCLQLMLPAA